MTDPKPPNPGAMSLAQYVAVMGTRTGTFTFDGVTYTNFSEVEWRQAHNSWLKPGQRPLEPGEVPRGK